MVVPMLQALTKSAVRLLIMTRAPSCANDLAIAKPIPSLEAVTKASLSLICKSIISPFIIESTLVVCNNVMFFHGRIK